MSICVDFEGLAQDLAAARAMLRARVDALEAEVSKIKKAQLPAIRKWAENAAERQQMLHQAVEEHPECFVKPKIKVLHGIKFGWRKLIGEMTWEDEASVVKLIKKHFADQVDVLIKTVEKPVKGALQQLPAADLKKLGITIQDDGDEVVIKFTDSEIDKIVNAILAEGENETA